MLLLKIAFLVLVSGSGGVNSLWTVSKVAVQKGGSITIPCHYHGTFRTNAKYWCQGRSWSFCKEMVRTGTKPSTAGVFITDYPSEQVFTITMTDLQEKDTNRYWCAVKMNGFAKATIRTSLELQVTEDPPDLSVMEDRVSVEEGDNVSIPCSYRAKLQNAEKKWCESGNLHSCLTASTMPQPHQPSVAIADDGSSVFTVTVAKLERKDTGWYWCSAGGLQVPVHINVTQRPDELHNSTDTTLTTSGVLVSSKVPGGQTTPWPTSEMARTASAFPSLQTTQTSQAITTAPHTSSTLRTHAPHVKTSATAPPVTTTETSLEQSTKKDTSSSAVLTSLASTTSASVQSSAGTTSTDDPPVDRHLIWKAVVIALGILMALVVIVGASVKCWHKHKRDHVRIALDDMTQELHMEEDLHEDIGTDWPRSCLLYRSEEPQSD